MLVLEQKSAEKLLFKQLAQRSTKVTQINSHCMPYVATLGGREVQRKEDATSVDNVVLFFYRHNLP